MAKATEGGSSCHREDEFGSSGVRDFGSSGVREFGSRAELRRFRSLGQVEPGVEPSCKCFGSLQGLEVYRAWKAMAKATSAAVEWFVVGG
jgi:hypothetical protein